LGLVGHDGYFNGKTEATSFEQRRARIVTNQQLSTKRTIDFGWITSIQAGFLVTVVRARHHGFTLANVEFGGLSLFEPVPIRSGDKSPPL
jgi:hypothetical protein